MGDLDLQARPGLEQTGVSLKEDREIWGRAILADDLQFAVAIEVHGQDGRIKDSGCSLQLQALASFEGSRALLQEDREVHAVLIAAQEVQLSVSIEVARGDVLGPSGDTGPAQDQVRPS